MGISGTNNTEMVVLTRTLAADTINQLGDSLRIRAYFYAQNATPITASIRVNNVIIADTPHSGAGVNNAGLVECTISYVDATHAHLVEQEVTQLGEKTSTNVSGFSWDSDQTIEVWQDKAPNNHITIFNLQIDLLPRGVV